MKKIAAYLFLALLIICLPAFGNFIGGVVGKSMDERRLEDQLNRPWVQIDSPYKFAEIVEANPNSVWAKTPEGKLYYLNFYCNGGFECAKWEWIATKEIPADIHNAVQGEYPLEKGKACSTAHGSYPEPPQPIVECVFESYMGIVYFGTYYVLLDDGTIWLWTTPVGNDGPTDSTYVAIEGFVLGLVLSILTVIAVIIFVSIQNRKET